MSAVPTLRTWTPGELATAAILNSAIRDAGDFFLTPPWVWVSSSADQTINNNVWTTATWNSTVREAGEDMFPGSGGTVTVVRAGMYTLHGTALFQTNATGVRGIRFLRNGSVIVTQMALASYATPAPGQLTIETGVNVSDPGVSCVAGDTFVMQVFQNSGGNLALHRNYAGNLYSWFSVRWVAAS